MSTARIVPTMPPRPPARLAPPRTTAVTTVSSRPMLALTDAPPTWDSRISPDRPAASADGEEGDEDVALGADAGQAGGRGAGTGGVHRPAVGGVAQDQEGDDHDRREDVDGDGDLQRRG